MYDAIMIQFIKTICKVSQVENKIFGVHFEDYFRLVFIEFFSLRPRD